MQVPTKLRKELKSFGVSLNPTDSLDTAIRRTDEALDKSNNWVYPFLLALREALDRLTANDAYPQ